ncbi:MAG: SsrA-binding protein SmpB [Clostridiales Family XIII bacterium]|jgi:SsrA-binding protein|nr:SsrA-binding protein SmpB [Clostridiales Family XIII bacterium]
MAKKKIITNNKSARHDYFIIDSLEAGMELTGTEIKSVRAGRVSLKESYARVENGEVFIIGMNISPYSHGNIQNTDPLRTRRLLLHKKEIRRLNEQVQQQGHTLIPLSVYLDEHGRAKMEIAVGKGKKLYDKRDSIAKRDAERRIQQIKGRKN